MKTNNQNIDNWQNKRLKNLNLLIFPTSHLNNIIFHFSIHFSHSRTILSKLVNVWKTKMRITRNMQFPGINDPSRKKYKCKNKRTDDRRKRIKGKKEIYWRRCDKWLVAPILSTQTERYGTTKNMTNPVMPTKYSYNIVMSFLSYKCLKFILCLYYLYLD
jgi:hypothetical protein